MTSKQSTRLLCFFWLALAVSYADAPTYSVVSTSTCSQYYSEFGTLRADDFMEQAGNRARIFLDETRNMGFNVRDQVIAKNRVSVRPPHPAISNYRAWRNWYLTPQREEIARVFAIGESASIQVNNGAGNITRTPLVGIDPFRGRVGDLEFEVIQLSFWGASISRSAEERRKSDCNAEIFVRTPATLNDETAMEITHAILQRLSVSTNSALVVLRNDDWFFGFGYLSHHVPGSMQEKSTPPKTKTDFDKLVQFNCFAGRGPDHCYRAYEKK